MQAPLRVLIVDDEAPARRRLATLLAQEPDVTVIGESADGVEAVRRIGVDAPDLVLLDIRMPNLDGFGVIAAVGAAHMPDVIFTTAYEAHAVQAFEVRALDYLLKPVEPARLHDALARVRARREAAASSHLLAHARDGTSALVALAEVVLARAQRNYVALHTARGVFRTRGTLAALQARLDPACFLQVNRSDIVRLDAIATLERGTHGDFRVTLPDGQALLWSRRFRAREAERFLLRRPDQPAEQG